MKKTSQKSPQPQANQPVENPVENSQTSTQTPEMKQIRDLTNDLQRTRADFENFRKQTELQKSQAMTATKFATVSKVLPLLDDIDRAINTYQDQLSPLAKNLEKTLKELNLEKINSNPDTEFNPDFHDAVMVEGDGDNELVAETLRPGYLYEGNILRPAMVKVKKC